VIRRRIIYSSESRQDIDRIFLWIARKASAATAFRYINKLQDKVETFQHASERGVRRDDLEPGLRVAALADRTVMAFKVVDDKVLVGRIFYGGQDWEAALRAPQRGHES
jgi:toxin ParE1/3/4